ncbi:MCE family protein [Amycolatopsis sp. K13G38]|uniref:MCE family protein n=1 Tax=Amycolatopsis acididurans TaxID=2724524 RepID=A0ABX1J2M2_9PSEU|nr:MlaD family protein [Amycolatopsis acididurans]NKQ53214.1 MCE family protein [Amycolatopsis acididurans]
MRGKKVALIAVVATAVVGAVAFGAAGLVDSSRYELQVEVPSAEGVHEGGNVMADGVTVGDITSIATKDGKALLTVALSGHDVPFHAGTTARISWDSLIGARHLDLVPGPQTNPVLPSGHLITSSIDRVELDQVLAAFTPETRQSLDSLVSQLQNTVNGHEPDMNAMLKNAGPAIGALAQVLQAVGSDGPALQDVVTRLNSVVGTLVDRQQNLKNTVGNVGTLTSSVAGQQGQLSEALKQLPSTLTTTKSTLDKVPSAVDAALPLLNTLAPAIDELPALSNNLGPLLTDLRPAVAKLDPTLVAAQTLLTETPGLLDSAHAAVPGVSKALQSASPAVAFLRPYIPDLMGWLTEWGSAFSPYDSQGHYIDALINSSGLSLDNNPGVPIPFVGKNDHPQPGYVAGQPWTDANGSGMR